MITLWVLFAKILICKVTKAARQMNKQYFPLKQK